MQFSGQNQVPAIGQVQQRPKKKFRKKKKEPFGGL